MKILFEIFKELSDYELDNYIKSILCNFEEAILYVKSSDKLNVEILKKNNVNIFNSEDYNAIIKIIEKPETFELEKDINKLNYYFDNSEIWWKFRIKCNDADSYKKLDISYNEQIFNKLGPINTDYYYYFPYSYNFRCTGLGLIDKYGFRKKNNFLQSNQTFKKYEYKICILGGSAAWGFNNIFQNTFGSLIENNLNLHFKEYNLNIEVTNFAQHGHLVLNEMITYLLHVEKLNPNLVILHDGFNDLLYGMLGDNALLEDQITYQNNHENISQKIHDTNNIELTQNNIESFDSINNPALIIDSYIQRKKQLIKSILNNSTDVISGFQPFLYSKKTLHNNESSYLEKYNVMNSQFGKPYTNIRYLYEKIQDNNEFKECTDLNFNELFSNEKENLFIDFCHTNDYGEEVIAKHYCKNLIKILEKKLNE